MLAVVQQAFKDIESYIFNKHESNKQVVIDGKEAIDWMKNMTGTFKDCAEAANMDIHTFRELCMGKLKEYEENKIAYDFIARKLETMTSKHTDWMKTYNQKLEKRIKVLEEKIIKLSKKEKHVYV